MYNSVKLVREENSKFVMLSVISQRENNIFYSVNTCVIKKLIGMKFQQ